MRLGTLPMPTPAEPGVLPAAEVELRRTFLEQVDRIPGGALLRRCIQCGTCSGTCPVGYAMDYNPRQVVAMFRAGAIEPLLRSRTVWVCASCYHCTARCPAGIQITDLLYALKRVALETGILPRRFPAYALSELFVETVRRYGRNFETGLLLRFFLRTAPARLAAGIGEGLALWRRGRLAGVPRRIHGIDGLRRIIARAETIARPQEAIERERLTAAVGYRAVRTRPAVGEAAAG